MDQMWRLADFRFDEGIEAEHVYLLEDELVHMSRAEALARAHERGGHLIAQYPPGEAVPSCVIGQVSLPVRWERVPDDQVLPDERLWFEASCGGRDLLFPAGEHTFRGRLSAWCPDNQVAYAVSLDELGEMADETRYFVRGYLAGNEPGPPYDDDHELDDADLAAWHSATARFRRTGQWHGRWKTCATCGCVLLPDTADDRCHEHR